MLNLRSHVIGTSSYKRRQHMAAPVPAYASPQLRNLPAHATPSAYAKSEDLGDLP